MDSTRDNENIAKVDIFSARGGILFAIEKSQSNSELTHTLSLPRALIQPFTWKLTGVACLGPGVISIGPNIAW